VSVLTVPALALINSQPLLEGTDGAGAGPRSPPGRAIGPVLGHRQERVGHPALSHLPRHRGVEASAYSHAPLLAVCKRYFFPWS
jgi:hypothetical protein